MTKETMRIVSKTVGVCIGIPAILGVCVLYGYDTGYRDGTAEMLTLAGDMVVELEEELDKCHNDRFTGSNLTPKKEETIKWQEEI